LISRSTEEEKEGRRRRIRPEEEKGFVPSDRIQGPGARALHNP
jgi:hypothetical protein